MQFIYYGDVLQHHGIKGQRWGIRRFQPYPKGHTGGKEVGEAATASKERHNRIFDRTVKQGKDKPAISPAEKVANDANKATQEAIGGARKIIDAAYRNKPKVNRAEGLSNEELQKRINRLRLEKDYNSLTDEDTDKGYEKAMLALSTIGSVATIAATTTGIIATIKAVKK